MINKITAIKSLGIYKSFKWGKLPAFKKYNLIFGWNRSGKSTLSRIFAAIELKSLYHEELNQHCPADANFEIEYNGSTKLFSRDIGTTELKVKVFNADFIENNLSFNPSKKSQSILYISDMDINTKKNIERLKLELNQEEIKLREAAKILAEKQKTKNSSLQNVGRTVANLLFDKNYNRSKVEARLKEIGFTDLKSYILDEVKLKEHTTIAKRELGKLVRELDSPTIGFGIFRDSESIFNHIKKLLGTQILVKGMDSLKSDPILKKWLQEGFLIHADRHQYKKCLFCENSIDNTLFQKLSDYFTKDYLELKDDIEFFLSESKQFRLSHYSVFSQEIYVELQRDFSIAIDKLNTVQERYNHWLHFDAEALIDQKLEDPLDSDLANMLENPNNIVTDIIEAVNEVNRIIKLHNHRVTNHKELVEKSKLALELNAISTATGDEVINLFTELKTFEEEFNDLTTHIEARKAELSLLESKTSSILPAITKINEILDSFFGNSEIRIKPDDELLGYEILRNGMSAKSMSEGEKTAIALAYFIAKCEEKGFIMEDVIIFIDDPISSLDTNFIYHCYTLITSHFRNAKQLFISTHNFSFFNLVKGWLLEMNKRFSDEKNRVGAQAVDDPAEFFMINNKTLDNSRVAEIIELDKTLKKFKSEYQYLFLLLWQFLKNTQQSYSDCYTVGNIARRFLEIYCEYKIPNSSNLKQKIEALIKQNLNSQNPVSNTEGLKVYKLINEYSHAYEPLSGIQHTDRTELASSIDIIFRLIKNNDPLHHETLEKFTKNLKTI